MVVAARPAALINPAPTPPAKDGGRARDRRPNGSTAGIAIDHRAAPGLPQEVQGRRTRHGAQAEPDADHSGDDRDDRERARRPTGAQLDAMIATH
jgi:hypothetical protein